MHSVILSDILSGFSGILSDIDFHILFGNLCCKYYDVLSDIVSGILSVLYSEDLTLDILSGILSDIYSDMLSDSLFGI